MCTCYDCFILALDVNFVLHYILIHLVFGKNKFNMKITKEPLFLFVINAFMIYIKQNEEKYQQRKNKNKKQKQVKQIDFMSYTF